MRISDMNWMQVEAYLKSDDRCVLPLGCTEQHAYLSLSVDSISAERMALETAEPENVPVFPVVPYGITPYFTGYPGTISLSVATYFALIADILANLYRQGFRRVLIVNGHGGNSPAASYLGEWNIDYPDMRIQWHDWWKAPQTFAKVQAIDPVASHASWMENFPWTRLEGIDLPSEQKPMVDYAKMRQLNPTETRDYLGDGNMGGIYQRSNEDMQAIWDIAIAETRALLVNGWV